MTKHSKCSQMVGSEINPSIGFDSISINAKGSIFSTFIILQTAIMIRLKSTNGLRYLRLMGPINVTPLHGRVVKWEISLRIIPISFHFKFIRGRGDGKQPFFKSEGLICSF